MLIKKKHNSRSPNTTLTCDPNVEEQGDDRRALHEIDPVVRQPVECLEEQQYCEQCHKLGGEVVAENSEGEAGLRDSIERTLDKVLWWIGRGIWNKTNPNGNRILSSSIGRKL